MYTTSNIVNHLRKHPEKYKKYEELKVAKEKEVMTKADKQITSELKLKQVSLAKAEDLHKVWDINDHQVKLIHMRIAEMIALD